MKPCRLIIIFIMLLLVPMAWGQNANFKKADAYMTKGEYYKAKNIYLEAQKSGQKLDYDTKLKLARCYYELNDVDKAWVLYPELNEEKELTGHDVFLYASILQRVTLYEDAIALYEKSKQFGENPIVVNELIKGCQWAMENETYIPNLKVNPSSMVTFGQSFGIQYYKNGVVYSSALESKTGKNVDKLGMSFLNLYYSDLDDNGDIAEGKRIFSENLVFPFHVGAISFTSDYNTMYFTRSVLVKGGRDIMKIFSVEFDGKEWGKPVELSINSNDYDCAMPAVSPDGKLLYFVSNKKSDTHGGKDIFVAEIKKNNQFGEVKNVGPDVNTFADEVFPVISKDNVLYFSSNGHYGFGGLDIFSAENINSKWTNVKNLLKPYNSPYDDFGYVIDPENKDRGFLASRNLGNHESDIIFYVRYTKPKEATQIDTAMVAIAGLENLKSDKTETVAPVEVTPVDAGTGLPQQFTSLLTSTFNGTAVGGANIVLRETTGGKVIGEAVSDENGKFVINIPEEYRKAEAEFEVEVSKGSEFNPKKVVLSIQEFEEFKKNGIALTPIFKEADLNEIEGVVIPYLGNEITAEGNQILDRLAAFLLNNPNIVIKLNGHTEARGNRYDNLTISQQVAEKAENYLKQKGVPDANMIPRGYAERYLINKCKRGKICSNEEHLKNRRIEVVVWKRLNP